MKKLSFSAPYAAAVLSSFSLLFLNFNALYNYGSGYDIRILIVNFIFFMAWVVVYLIGKKYKFPLYGIILANFLFICIIIVFCENIFDSGYGILDIATVLLNRSIDEDILYHSAIAESLANYYRPSILVNGLDIRNYHYFSHIIIALISKITDIPPFFVYNYMYPQIFITFFMYLYFRLILSIGNHFSCSELISTLFGCILLLIQVVLIDPAFIIRSQSHFISIILCLIYFNIIDIFNLYYLKLERKSYLIYNLITIFSIFIISVTKISTGLIFLGVCSWFYLRHSQPLGRKIPVLLLYSLTYLLALMVCRDTSDGVAGVSLHNFSYSMLHTSIKLPWLVLLVILIGFGRFFLKHSLKDFLTQKQTILEECLLIGFIICILLSLVLNYHWDLYYFVDVLSFFGLLGCFIIIAKFYLNNINYYLKKFKYLLLVFCSILLYFFLPAFEQDFKALSHTFSSLKHQRSVQASMEHIPGKLSFNKYFSKSSFFDSKLYRMICAIRKISGKNKDQYGIYVSKDNSFKLTKRPRAGIFFYQGLTGLVHYAPMYRTDEGIFVNSGIRVTKDKVYPYFGLKKVNIPPAVSLDNAQGLAKADGKKYLFYIHQDNLYLINLETNSTELIELPSS